MTLTWMLVLSIVAALVLGWALGWLARGARIKRVAFDAQIAAYERTIEKRHTPQHARTQPQASLPPQMQNPAGPSFRRAAGPAPNRVPAKRMVTTAADIAPVFWPQPGTRIPMRPQPGRTSGNGTRTLPQLTDTGELRAITDAWIDKMRREDVEWRAQTGLTS